MMAVNHHQPHHFNHQNPYAVLAQPSPMTSPSHTPAHGSPTSPKITNPIFPALPPQSKQLQAPRTPLYVPAALRVTERPTRNSPPTPPKSLRASLDSSDDSLSEEVTRSTSADSQDAFASQFDHAWYQVEQLADVTGSPTRDHWKADSASVSCDSPSCRQSFNIIFRRHHCRHCGHIFCATHTPHTIPLDQDARFHPNGVPSRACHMCWSTYRQWEDVRNARLKAQAAAEDSGSDTPRATATASTPVGCDDGKKGKGGAEIAASVPRDWSWSTF